MLLRLLRSHLAPYRRELWLVVTFQALQTIATLYLPSLNADIIDNGVIPGDEAYVWSRGAVMLVVTVVQVGLAVAAVYFA
jgi:ATP-binding cassette subfamily B protein